MSCVLQSHFISSNFTGIPKNAWKMKQQSGRIGRDGQSSLDVTLVFPQKGKSWLFWFLFKALVCTGSAAPEPNLRKAMRGTECIRYFSVPKKSKLECFRNYMFLLKVCPEQSVYS